MRAFHGASNRQQSRSRWLRSFEMSQEAVRANRIPAWAAALALLCGCSSDTTETPVEQKPEAAAASLLGIEVVSTRVVQHPTVNDRDDFVVFRVTNNSDQELGFWGDEGKTLVSRLAAKAEDRWVEEVPIWAECRIGQQVGWLSPGETIEVQVWLPAVGPTYRAGFGYWLRSEGEHPSWMSWQWTWSEPFEAPEELLSVQEQLRDLSREEVWAQGVERLRWRPEEPPEDWTKEMMLERFSVDTKYWDWGDFNDYE
jgi:hypothetical protein